MRIGKAPDCVLLPDKKYTSRLVVAALAAATLVFLIRLWWISTLSSQIYFLDQRAPAEWILYPKPPDPLLHNAPELSTVFRRSFVLEGAPGKSTLSLRAMKRWTLAINRALLEPAIPTDGNWKDPVTFDVAGQLHPGTNEIMVTVYNTNGPPALWLALDAGGARVVSDSDWAASLWGAAWRNARTAASFPVEIAPGNGMYGGERPLASLLRRLPTLLLFGVLSFGLVAGGQWWLQRSSRRGDPPSPIPASRFAALVLGVVSLLWLALFLNNMVRMPYGLGFDASAHLDYIDDVRRNWRLPLASEGFQRYQPPLYYFISALLLAPFHPANYQAGSIELLRIFGLVVGVVHFTLVFLSLRLLFPGRAGLPLFGLVLAAFLPEHIYMSAYISNEALAGALTTGAIYFCLRILKEDRNSPLLHAGLGLCLGAALLTKVTGVITVPFIGVALLGRLLSQRQYQPRIWAGTVGLAGATTLGVCGWYYLRVWRLYGSPIIGNWNPASGYHWWMDDGFHTLAYYFRFGHCLTYPWFSGFHGFADGLYSTFWGDGLCGGVINLLGRPPWNYELMAAGFLLALWPTLLILLGAARALLKFVAQPDPAWFLLIGIAGSTLAALIYMSFQIPCYGQVKAFYGLIALLPICAFGALGWDLLTRHKIIFMAAATVLGIWAITSYASFWIQPGNPAIPLDLAWILQLHGDDAEAARSAAEALRLAPQDLEAQRRVARDLLGQDRVEDAKQLLQAALLKAPDDAESHTLMASVLDKQDQLAAAVAEAQLGIKLSPDRASAYSPLCDLLIKQGRYQEALAVGREGLRANPFTAELHYRIGLACADLADDNTALVFFRRAIVLNPKLPEAWEQLGMSLLALGQNQEALTNLQAAEQLKPRAAVFHYNLALGYGALGKTSDAIGEYQQALLLSPDDLSALNNLALVLATDPDPQLRNGPEAVQLALRACDLTEHKPARFLATLAAAYAEAGQFTNAVAAATDAIAQANAAGETNLAASNARLLELYRAGQPYHLKNNPNKTTDEQR